MFFPRQLDSWFFATMMLVAAAPSVIILCFSKLYLMPSAISSSSIRTKSSIVSLAISKVNLFSKPMLPPKQSARVFSSITSMGLPAFKLSYIDGPLFMDTPITLMSGFCFFKAMAIPPINPPPEVGTMTVSKFGSDSNISNPIVPCPEIICSSSNGWIKVTLFFFAYSRAL